MLKHLSVARGRHHNRLDGLRSFCKEKCEVGFHWENILLVALGASKSLCRDMGFMLALEIASCDAEEAFLDWEPRAREPRAKE